jgi:enoyl-CoA hydratase/carnithine racemase
MSVVLVERRVAGVGELVINRADRKNSLTPLVAAQLVGGLEELIGDETIKAIIFRGAGGFLCAGPAATSAAATV